MTEWLYSVYSLSNENARKKLGITKGAYRQEPQMWSQPEAEGNEGRDHDHHGKHRFKEWDLQLWQAVTVQTI